MKRIILTVMTLVLTLALCACKGGDSTTASGSGNGGLAPNTSAQGAGDNQPAGNKPSNVKPSAEKPSGDNQPATNDPGIDDGQGAPTYDDMPSGVDYMIAEDVYYYELYMLEGDSGEGLTTLDGAYLVNDLMIDLGFYNGDTMPYDSCIYITFDDLVILDATMGRECYMYTVAVGTVEGGLMGDGFEVFYRVAVDYSGTQTAFVYDDYTGGSDPGDNVYYGVTDPADLNWWGDYYSDFYFLNIGNYNGESFSFTLDGSGGVVSGVAALDPGDPFLAQYGDIYFTFDGVETIYVTGDGYSETMYRY